MKTSLIILVGFLVSFALQAQNTLRVSNMPGSNAPYSTIQAAVAAASSGDIILVDGSNVEYTQDIPISKKLTIQGPGYFLNENTQFQFNQNMAQITYSATLIFNPGSEGSAVYGMSVANLNVYATNITISNNYLRYGVGLHADYATITQNYSAGAVQFTDNLLNVVITNNYLAAIYMTNTCNAIVSNNVIFAGYSQLWNSPISNNIFNDGGSPLTITNCVISHNVFTHVTVPGADATNILGADYYSIFTLTGTTDTQWMLKAGSPAIGAGFGGVDCGMYGGITAPYRPSGIRPGQPTISNFSSPATVPQNGTLNISVSAKVN
jgi:hypothetical protein